ncbi:unnamed protein product [Clavelina lepadiformis]|uniref:Tetratricopeptide repeat protein 27 n=1 Tax=Clavelina lepadiformis TaxID=159417 RepID=A0ABP0FIW2_CLALP
MSFDTLQFELDCISCKERKEDYSKLCEDYKEETNKFLHLTISQKYAECLKSFLKFQNIFESLENITSTVADFLENGKGDTEQERHINLFCCAVSSVQLFVQLNWTGPFIDIIYPSSQDVKGGLDKVRNLLSADGNSVYHLVKAPHYLYAAKHIFEILSNHKVMQTASWWLFRCHCLHSQLIDGISDTLYGKTTEILDEILCLEFLKTEMCLSHFLQLHLEAGLSLLYYYHYKQADVHFQAARKIIDIDFGFTGALGKRTKFQQKAVAQLRLLVKRKSQTKMKSTISAKDVLQLPKNLALNDEVLLEKIKLMNEEEEDNTVLTPEENAVILVACTAMQKTSPSHRLEEEKIETVVEYLLNSSSCWSIHTEALRVRCMSQRNRSRTVERSMMQMDALVATATNKKGNSDSRLDLFYCVRPPTIWILERDLAKLYMSLGAVSSALKIYERLEMWEEAILCLIQTERNSEAMKMVNVQLKTNETPNLWCLLGDIMQEPKHYLKAWELSNHHSARSMKSLGYYYISKKDYPNAVECLQKSLSVLSLQVDTWFTTGCAFLAMEDYNKAAEAFRRCVNLDWDNYEAWANLSASYIKCGKKEQAFRSLSEAIKCNFDKWQLWENYVAVATDVGHFGETIHAYNRLMDLKNKYVDVPVLSILVRAVKEKILDSDGNPGYKTFSIFTFSI